MRPAFSMAERIAELEAQVERLERDLTPETTEVRAAEMFAANVKAEGGDDISFETIVAGGPNGAPARDGRSGRGT